MNDKADNNSSLSAYTEFPVDVKFSAQEPDEDVLLLLRRHPLTNVPWIIILIFLLAFPLLTEYLLRETPLDPLQIPFRLRLLFMIFWYLFCTGYAILSFFTWFFNIYIVTNERIVDLDYFGFLFYRLSEAELSQIQDVTYELGGAFQTIFNFGNVYIQTAAEKREFDFSSVPNPARIHDLITDLAQIYD